MDLRSGKRTRPSNAELGAYVSAPSSAPVSKKHVCLSMVSTSDGIPFGNNTGLADGPVFAHVVSFREGGVTEPSLIQSDSSRMFHLFDDVAVFRQHPTQKPAILCSGDSRPRSGSITTSCRVIPKLFYSSVNLEFAADLEEVITEMIAHEQ